MGCNELLARRLGLAVNGQLVLLLSGTYNLFDLPLLSCCFLAALFLLAGALAAEEVSGCGSVEVDADAAGLLLFVAGLFHRDCLLHFLVRNQLLVERPVRVV